MTADELFGPETDEEKDVVHPVMDVLNTPLEVQLMMMFGLDVKSIRQELG